MRKVIFFICCVLFVGACYSQDEKTDSLLAELNKTNKDSTRINILNQIAASYFNSSPEKAIMYGQQAKKLAEDISYKHGLAYALKNIGLAYYMQGDYIQTLTYWNASLNGFQEAKDKTGTANMLSNLGAVYSNQGDDEKALDYYLKSLKYAEEINDTLRLATVLNNIGSVYFNKTSTRDNALSYYLKALPYSEALEDDDAIGTITVNIGEIYLDKNEDSLALEYFQRSVKAYANSKNLPYSLNDIAKIYEKNKDYTTALKYHQQALDISKTLSAKLEMSQSYQGIATVYSYLRNTSKALEAYKNAELIAKEIAANYELEKIYKGLADTYAALHDYPDAYKYQALLTSVKDTLYNAEKDKKLAFLQFNFEMQKKQGEIDLLTKDKTLKDLALRTQTTAKNSLIAVLSLVMLLVFILFRNYRIKDRTNTLLDTQKKELEQTLSELKTTQAQLIQSEKMASLGELTAGIAHEIQNPLNFINNFSEVNKEMLEELKDELERGNIEGVSSIANDAINNQMKIINHGKRADAIVKGMLQHSRKSKGQKEQTNINGLCEECLRLSYHGFCAKDKSFNADFKTDFDNRIETITVVSQDIVRVLLNLFNNAFYAVDEKKKNADKNYKPFVSVQTKKINNQVEIIVKDNGNGISQNIIDKIFNPFFTTKPSGQGTGLGLSLAYDIITKEHNGKIKAESKEGEGSSFIIILPAT